MFRVFVLKYYILQQQVKEDDIFLQKTENLIYMNWLQLPEINVFYLSV